MMDWLLYPLAFAGLLGVLVVVHEFGHFIVARLAGVHVLSFSVGFGKALLSRVDKNGTTFKLSMIPLGGYVRMYDTRDDAASLQGMAAVPADVWRIRACQDGGKSPSLLPVRRQTSYLQRLFMHCSS